MDENPPSASPTTGDCPLGSLENPIRVKGINGEINYLQRLFTLAHEPLFYHRLRGRTEENVGPLDVYEFVAQDNSGRWVLAFSRHHRNSSDEAPEGLWFAPESPQVPPYNGTTIGVDKFVKNFPMRLPSGLRRAWMGSDPELPKYVESLLSRFTPEEWRTQPYKRLLAAARTHRPTEIGLSEFFSNIPKLSGNRPFISHWANPVQLGSDGRALP